MRRKYFVIGISFLIALLKLASTDAGIVSVAGLVEMLKDSAPVPKANVVLSATRRDGGKLSSDSTADDGIFNLASSSVLDTTQELFVWCESPYHTRPQLVPLDKPQGMEPRAVKARRLRVPPPTGPLAAAQVTYSLVAAQETGWLKVKLELQKPEEAAILIRQDSAAILARFPGAKNAEALNQILIAVDKIPRQEWLREFPISAGPAREALKGPEFERAWNSENARMQELGARLRDRALRDVDIDFLLNSDLAELPVDWLLGARAPELLQSYVRRNVVRNPEGLKIALVYPRAPRIDAESPPFLDFNELNSPSTLEPWLKGTPAAREALYYEMLGSQVKLSPQQSATLARRSRQLNPPVVLVPMR